MTRMNDVRPRLLTLLVLMAIVAFGCTVRTADLTLVSTKNIDLSDARLDVRGGERVKGSDCVFSLLGIIPLGVPNLEESVDDALEKGNGNIMVDQVTYLRSYWFVLVTQSCIDVEGTVLSTQ